MATLIIKYQECGEGSSPMTHQQPTVLEYGRWNIEDGLGHIPNSICQLSIRKVLHLARIRGEDKYYTHPFR